MKPTHLLLAALLGTLGPALAAAEAPVRSPGFVDGSAFSALAGGDDAETIEVSLEGPLLRAVFSGDPELKSATVGLESIHAVILGLKKDDALRARAQRLVQETQARLKAKGWVTLAMVRDGQEQIFVMTLSKDATIQGLVVLVVDPSENQVVFTNIAGTLDLAAIKKIGEKVDVPGLEHVK
ncbi:MAG TPA: DUF4252 domain-containing protein [Candidatus Polarisedimenticolaceae bacterium]|nr:DUF4252 domain-containing protein [Candidatus Polarisedimenticolaceae bacterium]